VNFVDSNANHYRIYDKCYFLNGCFILTIINIYNSHSLKSAKFFLIVLYKRVYDKEVY